VRRPGALAGPTRPGAVSHFLVYVRRSYRPNGAPDISDEMQVAAALSMLPADATHEVIADSGGHHSGRTDRRDGYQELIRRIESGTVAGIAVYDLSRLARNAQLMHNLKAALDRRNVPLLVANMPTSRWDTATGRFMFGQLVLAAQFQADLDSENARGRDERLFADGYHRGNPPRGYRNARAGDRRVLEVDPDAGATRRPDRRAAPRSQLRRGRRHPDARRLRDDDGRGQGRRAPAARLPRVRRPRPRPGRATREARAADHRGPVPRRGGRDPREDPRRRAIATAPRLRPGGRPALWLRIRDDGRGARVPRPRLALLPVPCQLVSRAARPCRGRRARGPRRARRPAAAPAAHDRSSGPRVAGAHHEPGHRRAARYCVHACTDGARVSANAPRLFLPGSARPTGMPHLTGSVRPPTAV
jgi:DNA invertase Pin-like site-specific DNA recombinase